MIAGDGERMLTLLMIRDVRPAPAKAALAAAALELFARRGVEAVSVRDIAKVAGYSNPALFRHFTSKEELARRLFETAYRSLIAAVETPAARGGLKPWLAAVVDEIARAPAASRFVLANIDAFWPQMPGELRSKNLPRLVREALERGREEGAIREDLDVGTAVRVIVGTLKELARSAHSGEERLEPQGAARDLAALLLEGIGPKGRR
jgi:AcrR family transcriptional regulator